MHLEEQVYLDTMQTDKSNLAFVIKGNPLPVAKCPYGGTDL